jgi:hypothetical protein
MPATRGRVARVRLAQQRDGAERFLLAAAMPATCGRVARVRLAQQRDRAERCLLAATQTMSTNRSCVRFSYT